MNALWPAEAKSETGLRRRFNRTVGWRPHDQVWIVTTVAAPKGTSGGRLRGGFGSGA
jgi:hypothetical protein